MTYTLTTIKLNSVHISTSETKPTLAQMQAEVGGYIELVPVFTSYEGEPCQAYVDEEGRFKQLPVNWPATRLWHDELQRNRPPLDRQPMLLPEIVGNLLIVQRSKS